MTRARVRWDGNPTNARLLMPDGTEVPCQVRVTLSMLPGEPIRAFVEVADVELEVHDAG